MGCLIGKPRPENRGQAYIERPEVQFIAAPQTVHFPPGKLSSLALCVVHVTLEKLYAFGSSGNVLSS